MRLRIHQTTMATALSRTVGAFKFPLVPPSSNLMWQAKCEVIEQIAVKHNVKVVLLQETHAADDSGIRLHGFDLIATRHAPHHGVATLCKTGCQAELLAKSPEGDPIQWTAIEIDAVTVVNVYKPPPAQLTALPVFCHPVGYAGDFTVNTKTGATTTPQPTVKSSLMGLLPMTSHCFLTTSSLAFSLTDLE